MVDSNHLWFLVFSVENTLDHILFNNLNIDDGAERVLKNLVHIKNLLEVDYGQY